MYVIKRIFVFICFMLGFVGWHPVKANPLLPLSENNYQQVLQHLLTVYDGQIAISQNELEAYLQLWVNPLADCEAPEVVISNQTATTFSFEWPVIKEAQYYRTGYISLESGLTDQINTSSPGVTFSNLLPELYLFAFLTDCGTGRSITHIIIVEKDLFRVEYNGGNACNCRGKNVELYLYNDPDLLHPVLAMHWSEPCIDYAQYRLEFTGHLFTESGEHRVLTTPLSIVYNDHENTIGIDNCNPDPLPPEHNEPEKPQNFDGDPETTDLFDVEFNSRGVFVNFNNEEFYLEEHSTEGTFCSCITSIPERSNFAADWNNKDHSTSFEKKAIRSFPNPFTTSVVLELPSPANEITHIHLYDSKGQILDDFVSNSIRISDQQNLSLQLDDYPSGMYFCQIQYGNTSYSTILLKVD